MTIRELTFSTGQHYHIFNRGVEKRTIYSDQNDYEHFLITLAYYRNSRATVALSRASEETIRLTITEAETHPLIDLLCYCLMPNHYHLLLVQRLDNGLTNYVRLVQNSYAHYFNERHHRVGPLFQGRFKAVHIKTDEQLLHLSRYIHLNPFSSRLTNTIAYPWSSYEVYTKSIDDSLANPRLIRELMNNQSYATFAEDYADYARQLELLKDLVLE